MCREGDQTREEVQLISEWGIRVWRRAVHLGRKMRDKEDEYENCKWQSDRNKNTGKQQRREKGRNEQKLKRTRESSQGEGNERIQ